MRDDDDHLDLLHRADQANKIERETIAPALAALPADYRYLTEQVDEMTQGIAWIDQHHQDSDDPAKVVWLLVALTALGQAVADVKKTVASYLVACRPVEPDARTGELKPVKQMEVNGVGLVEFKRSNSRKEWRNDDLWHDIVVKAQAEEWDALKVLGECVRPSWRVTPLKALGFRAEDYCLETPGDVSPVLPTRDLADRGKSWEMGEAS